MLTTWWVGRTPAPGQASSSQLPPHTAYRLGIIHFRALFSLIRLLPAYRLSRRLRRANNGLRMGIKLWGPEGYSNSTEGIADAWEVMERNLVGLDWSLHHYVSSEEPPSASREQYNFPILDFFGNEYQLGVEYRPEVDFHVEDLESVLSEKFVDMDQDWFTPTVARHRIEESRRILAFNAPSSTSPIPPRQQAPAPGSFGTALDVGSLARPITSKASSGIGQGVVSQNTRENVASSGSGRWGALAEGLPFVDRPSSSTAETTAKVRCQLISPLTSSGTSSIKHRHIGQRRSSCSSTSFQSIYSTFHIILSFPLSTTLNSTCRSNFKPDYPDQSTNFDRPDEFLSFSIGSLLYTRSTRQYVSRFCFAHRPGYYVR